MCTSLCEHRDGRRSPRVHAGAGVGQGTEGWRPPRFRRLCLASGRSEHCHFCNFWKETQSFFFWKLLSRVPDCTVHGILQARILESVAFPFSRGSSQPRNRTGVSCIAGGFFTNWAINKENKITDKRKKNWLDLGGSQIRLQTCLTGTFLVVQWLRLQAPSAEGPGSIPGQGTRSRVVVMEEFPRCS